MSSDRLTGASTIGPAWRQSSLLLAWAACAAILIGCSGQAQNVGTGEGTKSVVPPEGTAKTDIVTLGTLSPFLEDSPLVIRPGILVEFVAAHDATDWWNSKIEGPASGVTEDDSLGPWDVAPRDWETEPEASRPVTTGHHGAASASIPPGEYLVCAHFRESPGSRIAGCDEIKVPTSGPVYVFFDEGRAFVDTGHGPASDAYRSLSCRQQLRLGQQPDHLVHLGGGRYRCPSR